MCHPLLKTAIKSLEDEEIAQVFYEYLAKRVSDNILSEKLRELASMEASHTNFWEDFLKTRNLRPRTSKFRKLASLTLLKFTYRVFGLGFVIKLLEHSEVSSINEYLSLFESDYLSNHEKQLLIKIIKDETLHEAVLGEEEKPYKTFLDHVREIVLGMNDGLVEVLSVSAGLAGTFLSPLYVFAGGILVGVGGALSMGIGAYVSSKTSTQITDEKIRRSKLLSKVRYAYSDKDAGAETVGEGVLDDEEVRKDPKKAGLYTGLSYFVGSLVPLLPYVLFIPPPISVITSFISSAIALGLTGFVISVLGGLNIKRKILELLSLSMTAATVTYFIGRIANVVLGIEI